MTRWALLIVRALDYASPCICCEKQMSCLWRVVHRCPCEQWTMCNHDMLNFVVSKHLYGPQQSPEFTAHGSGTQARGRNCGADMASIRGCPNHGVACASNAGCWYGRLGASTGGWLMRKFGCITAGRLMKELWCIYCDSGEAHEGIGMHTLREGWWRNLGAYTVGRLMKFRRIHFGEVDDRLSWVLSHYWLWVIMGC